jgi:ABC-2 type transport system ATP-binding protein
MALLTGALTVVSALQQGTGMRYRVVAAEAPPDAAPAEPGLEDGYVALMSAARAPALSRVCET